MIDASGEMVGERAVPFGFDAPGENVGEDVTLFVLSNVALLGAKVGAFVALVAVGPNVPSRAP